MSEYALILDDPLKIVYRSTKLEYYETNGESDIEKLSFIESVEENILIVKFTLHKNLDKATVEKKAEFMLKKSIFRMSYLR